MSQVKTAFPCIMTVMPDTDLRLHGYVRQLTLVKLEVFLQDLR